MFDFLSDFGSIGTEGSRRMRIFTGCIGALGGGALGAVIASVTKGTTFYMISYGFVGALVGGFLAALFSAMVIIGLLCLLAVVAVVGWEVIKGRT